MITHICTVCNGQLLQWAPYEQNQHFKELRPKVGVYTQESMILRGLPSLDGKHKLFVTKRGNKQYSVNDKEKVMMNITQIKLDTIISFKCITTRLDALEHRTST